MNNEIEQEALKVTRILVATVGDEGSAVEKNLVGEITQECSELMSEPEKTQAIPATKVMGSLIGTTSMWLDYPSALL